MRPIEARAHGSTSAAVGPAAGGGGGGAAAGAAGAARAPFELGAGIAGRAACGAPSGLRDCLRAPADARA